ncbi:MAG: fatty acid desaturase [Bacteroidetes bacterium]|nr:fatty acid desaturase [Bacteroidota bacterium]
MFFTIVLALFIIGGKQLGCAIIMHDTSHYSLFKSRKTNIFIGNWFGAYPIIQNLEQYGPYHFQHHINTGTFDDPDLSLTKRLSNQIIIHDTQNWKGFNWGYRIKSQLGLISMHLGYLKIQFGWRYF